MKDLSSCQYGNNQIRQLFSTKKRRRASETVSEQLNENQARRIASGSLLHLMENFFISGFGKTASLHPTETFLSKAAHIVIFVCLWKIPFAVVCSFVNYSMISVLLGIFLIFDKDFFKLPQV